MTYAELDDKASRVAAALVALGLRPGDHVALCATNSPEWIVFYFGVLKAGGVAVTLSSLHSVEELTLLVNHAKPRFAFTDRVPDFQAFSPPAG